MPIVSSHYHRLYLYLTFTLLQSLLLDDILLKMLVPRNLLSGSNFNPSHWDLFPFSQSHWMRLPLGHLSGAHGNDPDLGHHMPLGKISDLHSVSFPIATCTAGRQTVAGSEYLLTCFCSVFPRPRISWLVIGLGVHGEGWTLYLTFSPLIWSFYTWTQSLIWLWLCLGPVH